MAGVASVAEYVAAHEAGQTFYGSWRKQPTGSAVAGQWQDLSSWAGNPAPNYYASAPLEAAVLSGARGLPHGGAVSPLTKHLHRMTLQVAGNNPLPMNMRLLDYLLYYPFLNTSTWDEQFMDNTVSLPRYTDGEGVQIMLVVTNPGGVANLAPFVINYVNQDGDAKTTPTNVLTNATGAGCLVTTQAASSPGSSGPFVTLARGDTGVREITSFRMADGLTDVALLAAVLVKPIATFNVNEAASPLEVEYLRMTGTVPKIADGAYLNLISSVQATMANVLYLGQIETVWC